MFGDNEVEPREDEIVSRCGNARHGFSGVFSEKRHAVYETHHISGAAVKLAVDKKVPLDQLTVDDLKPLCDKFEDDVAEIWSYEKSAESRDTEGGPVEGRFSSSAQS